MHTPRYALQLRAVVSAVRLDDATGFTWMGDSVPGPASEAAGGPGGSDDHLLSGMTQQLYSHFYVTGRVVRRGWSSGHPVLGHSRFVQHLVSANAGRGPWEAGWRITAVAADELTVERNGLALVATRADVGLPRGRRPVPGTQVAVHLPGELLRYSPGFYTAVSDEPMATDESPRVRLYWNVKPRGALRAVESLSRQLNEARIPFRLKALSDPGRYSRCDAMVLYLPAESCERAAPTVAGLWRDLSDARWIRRRVPSLTLPLAPGLGAGEDSPSGASFGQVRCLLIAEALVDAWRRRTSSTRARAEAVDARFRAAGLDPGAPYLSTGSEEAAEAIEAVHRVVSTAFAATASAAGS